MIKAYVGLMGEGKTLSMVNDGIELVRQGAKVFTNVEFKNAKNGFFDKNYIRQPIYVKTSELESLILKETNATFLIDEANIVFPSYFWNKLSPDYLIRFPQARKLGINLFYTTQGFTHVLSRLRELTNYVVQCKSLWFFNNHFFLNETYDALRYQPLFVSEFAKKQALVPGGVKRIYWNRARYLFKCFDSYKLIEASKIMGVDKEVVSTDHYKKNKSGAIVEARKTENLEEKAKKSLDELFSGVNNNIVPLAAMAHGQEQIDSIL